MVTNQKKPKTDTLFSVLDDLLDVDIIQGELMLFQHIKQLAEGPLFFDRLGRRPLTHETLVEFFSRELTVYVFLQGGESWRFKIQKH